MSSLDPDSLEAAPSSSVAPPLFRSGIIPSIHLARMLATSTPTICLVGDSKSTPFSANQLVPDDGIDGILQRRLQEDNPTKVFGFVNRGVGGQTWTSFNTAAISNFPSWYANPSIPWLAYVQATECDTLFISFGINDQSGITAAQIMQVLTKIAGWGTAPATVSRSTTYAANTMLLDPSGRLAIVITAGTTATSAPTYTGTVNGTTTDGTAVVTLLAGTAYAGKVPDIIFITNENANPYAPSTASINYQLGTLAAAAWVRSMALTNGITLAMTGNGRIAGLPPIGLIDLNRYFSMTVAGVFPHGFDPLDRSFKAYGGSLPIVLTTGQTLPATPAPDFDLTLTITNGSAWTGSASFSMTTSSPGGAAGSSVALVPNGTTGGVGFYVSTASGQFGGVGSGFGIPGIWLPGTNTVEITLQGNRLRAFFNGSTTPAVDTLTETFAKPGFAPLFTSTSQPAGSVISVTGYNVSQYGRRFTPLLSPAECWGPSDGSEGGNQINHCGSEGISRAVQPLFEVTRFG